MIIYKTKFKIYFLEFQAPSNLETLKKYHTNNQAKGEDALDLQQPVKHLFLRFLIKIIKIFKFFFPKTCSARIEVDTDSVNEINSAIDTNEVNLDNVIQVLTL